MSEPYKFPDDFRWSFSKQSCADQCGMMFKQTYLDKIETYDNCFSVYGTQGHSILEDWAKGNQECFELEDAYEERYNQMESYPFPPFPKGMAEKYYLAGKEYFASFAGFGDNYEVLSAEEKFELNIGGNLFVGIADLVQRDKNDGEIVVVDHKSKSMNSMKKELEVYKKQLYVYAAHVKEKYGVFPKLLQFNMYKDQQMIDEPFDIEKFNATMAWITETIERIKNETEWLVNESNYFCKFICGVKEHCPIGASQYKSG